MDFISRLGLFLRLYPCLILALAAPFFSSCGGPLGDGEVSVDSPNTDITNTHGSGAPAPCAQGLASFEKFLYAPIMRPRCAECHDGTGSGPASGPPHSSSDPVASYNLIKTYVDFTQSLEHSWIISMVKSAHWKDYDANASGTTVALMTSALQSWWDQGESSCPNYSTPNSAPLTVPSSLPLAPQENYVPMIWALDSLGAVFKGSWFQVEIQQLTAPTSTTSGAYRLRKPRFATSQPGLAIAGIQFFINGKPPLNAIGWENIQAKIGGHIPPSPSPSFDPFNGAPVLSGRPLILLQDQLQGDQLSVAFSGVQTISAPICRDLKDFDNLVLPVIQQSSCISCHSGGSPSEFNGSARLSLLGTDAQVCAAAIERTDFVHSDGSPFYLVGFLNENDHPLGVPAAASFSKSWTSWVTGEQSAELPFVDRGFR